MKHKAAAKGRKILASKQSFNFAKPMTYASTPTHPLVHPRAKLSSQQVGQFLQPKLKIGQPNDKYEQEADRVADRVMRMPEPAIRPKPTWPFKQGSSCGDTVKEPIQTKSLAKQIAPLVQRQEEEIQTKPQGDKTATLFQRQPENEEELLQAKVDHSQLPVLSPYVQSCVQSLRGRGQPLAGSERAFFEPRFGHDFSNVRIHADSRAAKTAQAISARAFTVGHDVIFAPGRYVPHTIEGKHLLAHELTHVIQQANPVKITKATKGENELPEMHETTSPMISRRVAARLTNCTAHVHGVPANPLRALRKIDSMAEKFAGTASIMLAIASGFISAGIRNPSSRIERAFRNCFGLPPAIRRRRGRRFLNRLTGAKRRTENAALGAEMSLMAIRFSLITRTFTGYIRYRCVGGRTFYAGYRVPHCNSYAWSATNNNIIFLCPPFWRTSITDRQRAVGLIHEAAHMNWARVVHGVRGSGGNFRHAQCYGRFIEELFNITPFPTRAVCVTPP